ncbi:hypothetical protein Bca4012_034430 [Brassica carinata]
MILIPSLSTKTKDTDSKIQSIKHLILSIGRISGEPLRLESLQGLLMSPSLDREIRLRVEPHAEDDDREEARDVAGKLPILPFPRLPRRRRSAVHEEALGTLLVAWSGPSARAGGCGSGSGEDPAS